MPQWSPALIGRERRQPSPHHRCGHAAAMEPCPYRQGEDRSPPPRATPPRAAMEPCPYRQGESARFWGSVGRGIRPQWSPALIGRERGEQRRAGRQLVRAAMEPCPYRQGESQRPTARSSHTTSRNGALPLSAGRASTAPRTRPAPRRSRNGALPLSAGRAGSCSSECFAPRNTPQWSPALIGRERCPGPSRRPVPTGSRNGALPLSAGRVLVHAVCGADGRVAAMEPCPYRQGEAFNLFDAVRALVAAMEPCPYRQGEAPRPPGPRRQVHRRNGALPLSAGRAPVAEPEVDREPEPQWSPALIGRESADVKSTDSNVCRSRNGALPLSAGRGVRSMDVMLWL